MVAVTVELELLGKNTGVLRLFPFFSVLRCTVETGLVVGRGGGETNRRVRRVGMTGSFCGESFEVAMSNGDFLLLTVRL